MCYTILDLTPWQKERENLFKTLISIAAYSSWEDVSLSLIGEWLSSRPRVWYSMLKACSELFVRINGALARGGALVGVPHRPRWHAALKGSTERGGRRDCCHSSSACVFNERWCKEWGAELQLWCRVRTGSNPGSRVYSCVTWGEWLSLSVSVCSSLSQRRQRRQEIAVLTLKGHPEDLIHAGSSTKYAFNKQ